MKKLNYLGRLSVLAVMFAMSTLAAMANTGGSQTYYSKVTAKSTGNGKVYVSYKNGADSPEYLEEASAESGADSQKKAPTHTYYIYAQPEEGYALKGWYTNEDCTDGFTLSGSVQVTADTKVDNATYTYYAKFTPSTEANLTIKAGKYGTFVAPFDVTLPEGVTAYSVEINGGYATLTEYQMKDRVLPAGNPVIVKSDADVNETFVGASDEAVSVTANGLVGFYQSGSDVPEGAYVLQTQNGEQGFYKVGSTTVNGVKNRCYLPAAAAGARLRIVLEDGENATAVNGVNSAATPAEYYSTNGVKVAAPQKGVNIVKMNDGSVKKMIVK